MGQLTKSGLQKADSAADQRAAELMELYCNGDQQAFHALYTLLANRLLGYIVNLIGERATAEDLLQQTFMKLHLSRPLYIRGANPVPWIFTIAQRTFLDECRRRQRTRVRVSRTGELPGGPFADLTGADETIALAPAEERLDPSDADRGVAALAHLPEAQRQALVLTKMEGRSMAEAASIAGTSTGAIKLRAHRGCLALRRILSKPSSGNTRSS